MTKTLLTCLLFCGFSICQIEAQYFLWTVEGESTETSFMQQWRQVDTYLADPNSVPFPIANVSTAESLIKSEIFGEDGRLSEVRKYGENGLPQEITFVKYPNERTIEKLIFDKVNNERKKEIYRYNLYGNLKEIIRYPANNESFFQDSTSYIYNKNQQLKKVIQVDRFKNKEWENFKYTNDLIVEIETFRNNGDVRYKRSFEYKPGTNQCITEKWIKDGQLIRIFFRNYNRGGKIAEETEIFHFSQGVEMKEESSFRYDGNGTLSSKITTYYNFDNSIEFIATSKMDHNGLLTSLGYLNPKNGTLSETEYKIIYRTKPTSVQ